MQYADQIAPNQEPTSGLWGHLTALAIVILAFEAICCGGPPGKKTMAVQVESEIWLTRLQAKAILPYNFGPRRHLGTGETMGLPVHMLRKYTCSPTIRRLSSGTCWRGRLSLDKLISRNSCTSTDSLGRICWDGFAGTDLLGRILGGYSKGEDGSPIIALKAALHLQDRPIWTREKLPPARAGCWTYEVI